MEALLSAALLPAPVAPVVEHPLTASAQGITLEGTWAAPVGKAKAAPVVIIPGSGPTDRDGNNPLGVRAHSLKLLAHALAREGVPSVRVDKRGMFGSAAPGLDPNAVTIPLYAADALAWAEVARTQAGAPCAWLLGHSEGALVAALAAQNAPKSVCGVISVAGPGRLLGDIMREQLTSNPANAPVLDQALQALDELEAGHDADTTDMHPALLPLFAPQLQPYLKSLLAQDPAALIRSAKGPVLIANGDADLQTTLADARALAAARPDATLAIWPGVNHVLKIAPADRAANLATYGDSDLPLAAGVVETIARFVRR